MATHNIFYPWKGLRRERKLLRALIRKVYQMDDDLLAKTDNFDFHMNNFIKTMNAAADIHPRYLALRSVIEKILVLKVHLLLDKKVHLQIIEKEWDIVLKRMYKDC